MIITHLTESKHRMFWYGDHHQQIEITTNRSILTRKGSSSPTWAQPSFRLNYRSGRGVSNHSRLWPEDWIKASKRSNRRNTLAAFKVKDSHHLLWEGVLLCSRADIGHTIVNFLKNEKYFFLTKHTCFCNI